MFFTRKLIPYRIGQYDQYFSFWCIKCYRNTLKLYHSKYWSILDYAEHTGEYRQFRVESKNWLVQKASKKKKKYQMAHVAFKPSTTLLLFVNIYLVISSSSSFSFVCSLSFFFFCFLTVV